MTLEDFIKQYRSGRNPITGEPNLYRELTDQTIWDAAQAEIRQLLDIEHRRRVAAEAVIEKCKHCVWHNHAGVCPDKCEPYIKWQSIIKEVGE